MPRLDLLKRPQPLIGILMAAAGWALAHQAGSNGVFDDCATREGKYVIVVSLIGLAITVAGGLYCLRPSERGGRSFLGTLGALLALLAGFATVLQILAGLIIPECAA